MPISRTESLTKLIGTLTKAEKRNFRLYAKRIQDTNQMMYLELFDIIDSGRSADDEAILEKMGNISRTQYSNLKRHLYTQLLVSLRLLHKKKLASIQMREYIDFAYVLYGRGLYMQSLQLLNKAKNLARQLHIAFAEQTIVEIEKTIESRHITRSPEGRTQELVRDAARLQDSIADYIKLSNLRIRLHDIYIRQGHIHTEKEYLELRQFFTERLMDISTGQLGAMHLVYLHQCRVWYHYITQEFDQCVQAASAWVSLFDEQPELKQRDVDLYMRGYHYLLTALYYTQDTERYLTHLESFESYRKENYKKFNKNSQIISFLYVHTGRLNGFFLRGAFTEGIAAIPRTLRRLKRYKDQLDAHRILVFYFKIAWMHLAAGQPGKAVDYLNMIIQLDAKTLRKDIQGYARVLLIIAHYDLGNYDMIDYLIPQYSRFIDHMEEENPVHSLSLSMFVELLRSPVPEHGDILLKYLQEFERLKEVKYEKRAFLYVDMLSWIGSKLNRSTIEAFVNQS